MSVLNKSNHPVFVKRVSIDTWSLRSEIEAKFATLIEKNDEKEIEKTKEFYSDLKTRGLEQSPGLRLADEIPKDDEPEETKDDEKSEEKKEAGESEEKKEEESVEDEPFVRVYPEEADRNKGFIFLSEINMQSILFFSKKTYQPGQNVVIEFHVTQKFTMCVEIIKSVGVVNKSKIISDKKPSYRILADLKFYFEGERDNLRNFLKSVEPDIPPPPKRIPKPTDDDDDDGVNLEDLGL